MELLERCASLILLLQLFVISSGISVAKNPKNELPMEEVFETWNKMQEKVKSTMAYGLRMAVPTVRKSLANLNLTEKCNKETDSLMEGLKNFEPWALRFLDSSGKMIDGIMVGTLSSLGIFEECLNTVAANDENGLEPFRGQYCTIEFKPYLPYEKDYPKIKEVMKNMNVSISEEFGKYFPDYARFFYFMSLRLGVCLPSGCTLEDVDKIGALIGEQFYINGKARRCKVKGDEQLSPMGTFTMCCYTAAGLLLLAGSLLDMYSQYMKVFYTSKLPRLLLAFSFISNFKKLVNTDSKDQDLGCLHGVRFLTIAWIILGHSYLLFNFQTVSNLYKIQRFFGDFAFQLVVNGTFSVDTFFFIGGLLACYLMIKKVKFEGKPFHLHLYILHRLWRIMPPYVFILLIVFLSDAVELGPTFKDQVELSLQACYKNWWTNLLFINNFYDYKEVCLGHSWYISCDFQLYVASLLILIPFVKSSTVGISLSIFGVLLSVVYSAAITYIKEFPPVPFLFDSLMKAGDFWPYYYGNPIVHLGPYCVGILTGYVLAVKPKLRIPPVIQVIGWCLSFGCNFAVLFGTVDWNGGTKATLTESICYAAFGRTGWAIGVAWVIICCTTGHAGLINYILSWPTLIPLGRLAFVAYLIHPLVQLQLLGNFTMLIPASQILSVWFYFGHLCLSFIAAFAGSMLIEAPFLALEKVILTNNDKSSNGKVHDSSPDKNYKAKNIQETFNEILSAQENSKNCIVIENKDFISKL